MNKELLQKIIEAGNIAPSGGNSQPWKFHVRGDEIDVIALPEKDHAVLNVKNRGTYIANGALLENISIMAKSLGYRANFQISTDEEVLAKVSFSDSVKDNELAPYLESRHSNRKPYIKETLSKEQKEYLFAREEDYENCTIAIVEGESIEPAAKILSYDISLNMQNKCLHKMLFEEVLWKEEDQKDKPGLYVKTMETEPPKSYMFRLLKNWNVAKFFTKIGLIEKIQSENTKTTSSAALIGAIIVSDNNQDFVSAGRFLENIWLRATKLGLSMHLSAAVSFLGQQVEAGEESCFSKTEVDLLKKLNVQLKSFFKVPEGKLISIAFRLGRGEDPLATSYKRSPEIEWSKS